ncbi:ArsR/SmtB family transcription factor [Streptomyces sp. NRAIS4]
MAPHGWLVAITRPGDTAALLGVTRARLLSGLQIPRSTAELSERHFLAASTISYHLSILHRSGLVTRTRAQHRIVENPALPQWTSGQGSLRQGALLCSPGRGRACR